jgi:hypothetical protein
MAHGNILIATISNFLEEGSVLRSTILKAQTPVYTDGRVLWTLLEV